MKSTTFENFSSFRPLHGLQRAALSTNGQVKECSVYLRIVRHSNDDKFVMRKRPFAFIVVITVVVTGMSIWFSSDHNHNNDFTIPVVISFLFALTISILTELQIMKIVIATTSGVMIALIIKIIIDWQFDPTSYNLFTFEIIIDSIIILIASLIGVSVGLICKKVTKRKFFDKND